jgi:hypothetical protein
VAMQFKKATKKQARAKVVVAGPAGSGKSRFALEMAHCLASDPSKVAAVDSERGSLAKKSKEFPFDGTGEEWPDFSPERYTEAIKAAEKAGYEALVIDSLSHAWSGAGGVLERVDQKGGYTGGGWKAMTPVQNRLVDAILTSPMHIICTLRTKTEYVIEQNEKGKSVPRKVGMAPVQRADIEYEFDVFAELDMDHNCNIAKTRCDDLDGKVFCKDVPAIAAILRAWLTDGEPVIASPKAEPLKSVPKSPPSAESAAPSAPSAAEHPIAESAKKIFGLPSAEDKARAEKCRDLAKALDWAVPHLRNHLKKNYKYNTEGYITALKPEDLVKFEAHLEGLMTARNEGAKE